MKTMKQAWVKDQNDINCYNKEEFIHNNDLIIK